LLLPGAVLAVETPQVYMVGKSKITGSAFMQVVFFKAMKLSRWLNMKRT